MSIAQRDHRPTVPLDEVDRLLISHLRRCVFLPASFDKRFARNMGHLVDRVGGEITDRQRSCLNALVYRYRRQIPATIVAKAALRLADEQATFRLATNTELPPIATPIRSAFDKVFATPAR